jgi:hypothetical protein
MMQEHETNACPDEDMKFRYNSMVIAAIEQRGFGKAYYFINDGPKVITSNRFNESKANRVINILYNEKLAPTLAPTLSHSPSASRIPSVGPSLSALPTALPTVPPAPTQQPSQKSAASVLWNISSTSWLREFTIIYILSCTLL